MFGNGAQTAAFQYLYNDAVHAAKAWIYNAIKRTAINAVDDVIESTGNAVNNAVNDHLARNKYVVQAGGEATLGGSVKRIPGSWSGPGTFVGVEASVALTSDGQLALVLSANIMAGYGEYAGVGVQGGAGVTNAPLITGVNTANVADYNYGNVGFQQTWGGGGMSTQVPIDAGRVGPGYGAMAAAGGQYSYIFAFPPLLHWRPRQ